MYTLKYHEITNLNVQEILKMKQEQLKEIDDYVKNNDCDEKILEIERQCKEEINSNFYVEINLKEISIDQVKDQDFIHLFKTADEINLNFQVFVSGCEYKNGEERDWIDLLFKDTTIERFKELNEILINNKRNPLLFIEEDITSSSKWELKHIIKSNDRVNGVCNLIKNYDLSPLETIAFIYKIVTKTFEYNENEENPNLARNIVGVLNSNYIVCVGYSSLIKAIIDKLDYENLRCECNTVKFKEKDIDENECNCLLNSLDGSHMQNLVFVKDGKYNVEGVYILDSTMDSKSNKLPSGKGFAYFMLPVEDVMHYSGYNVIQYEDSVDQILASFGIEAEYPEIPPFVAKYKDKSRPIPYDILETVIKKVLKIIFYIRNKKELENRLDIEMRISRINALYGFDENAKNYIYQETKNYEYKKIGN